MSDLLFNALFEVHHCEFEHRKMSFFASDAAIEEILFLYCLVEFVIRFDIAVLLKDHRDGLGL
jgi:hypothetical protein